LGRGLSLGGQQYCCLLSLSLVPKKPSGFTLIEIVHVPDFCHVSKFQESPSINETCHSNKMSFWVGRGLGSQTSSPVGTSIPIFSLTPNKIPLDPALRHPEFRSDLRHRHHGAVVVILVCDVRLTKTKSLRFNIVYGRRHGSLVSAE